MQTRQLSLALMMLAAACSPVAPESEALPPDPKRCLLPDDTGEAALSRDIAIGQDQPHGFEDYRDGQLIELVEGWQGGYMITPRVRVQALAGDGDTACWQLRLTNDIDADAVGPGMAIQLEFARQGDNFYSDAVADLLAYDAAELTGKELRLDYAVHGTSVDEQSTVTVLLQSPQ